MKLLFYFAAERQEIEPEKRLKEEIKRGFYFDFQIFDITKYLKIKIETILFIPIKLRSF